MQSLGLIYALEPAIEELYSDPERRRDAIRRHLAVFNTHPYIAAGLIGGILNHEARIARGEESPEAVLHFKRSLMGPLAALGDGFFWLSLRPALGAVSVALAPWIGGWAALAFFIAFNAVHVFFRAQMFRVGWQRAEGLVDVLGAGQLPKWNQRLRILAAGAAAFAGTVLVAQIDRGRPIAEMEDILGGFLLGAATYAAAHYRARPMVLLYAAALAAAAASMLK